MSGMPHMFSSTKRLGSGSSQLDQLPSSSPPLDVCVWGRQSKSPVAKLSWRFLNWTNMFNTCFYHFECFLIKSVWPEDNIQYFAFFNTIWPLSNSAPSQTAVLPLAKSCHLALQYMKNGDSAHWTKLTLTMCSAYFWRVSLLKQFSPVKKKNWAVRISIFCPSPLKAKLK